MFIQIIIYMNLSKNFLVENYNKIIFFLQEEKVVFLLSYIFLFED